MYDDYNNHQFEQDKNKMKQDYQVTNNIPNEQRSPRNNQTQESHQAYYPSFNDIKLGSQGYTSCSESQVDESGMSRSGYGADTFAGHQPLSIGGSTSHMNSYSRRSHASRAPNGMEKGNWFGMDSSIQNTTLQDTTIRNNSKDRNNISHDHQGQPHKMQVNPMNEKANNSYQAQQIYNQMNPLTYNRDNQVPHQYRPGGGSAMPTNIPPNMRIYPGLVPPNFGEQSTILEDTLMNQTQNKTLYTFTQTRNLNASNSNDVYTEHFRQVSPAKNPNDTMGSGYKPRHKKYNLTLKMYYKTNYGESLQVVGSIEELGSWKSYACPMKWTEGHVWTVSNLLVTSKSHFTYKYVVMFNNKAHKWERGPNRIADLEILPDRNKLSQIQNSFGSYNRSPDSRHSGMRSQKGSVHSSEPKAVELRDEWEIFTVRFSIYSQIEEESKEYMRIIGSIPELTKSGNVGSGPLKMKRCPRKFRWLYDKYGQEIRPWECLVKFKADKYDYNNEIIYNYSKSDQVKKNYIYEREPSRILKIQNPETYSGDLGAQRSSQWRNQDKVYIVNGHIEKADANFLGELFFSKIGDTGISIGTYPLFEEDIQRLQQAGITGVLNLQTVNDYKQRGIPWQKLQQFYKQRGIRITRFSVSDTKDKELQSNIFTAAQHLNNMVNVQGLNVYMHCTSGLSRSPAVLIVYLCLFKKLKFWQSVDDVAHYVKAFSNKITPNMRIIQKCLQMNQEFQNMQKEFQPYVLGNMIEDSFYFPNMIIEESKHNPILPDKQVTARFHPNDTGSSEKQNFIGYQHSPSPKDRSSSDYNSVQQNILEQDQMNLAINKKNHLQSVQNEYLVADNLKGIDILRASNTNTIKTIDTLMTFNTGDTPKTQKVVDEIEYKRQIDAQVEARLQEIEKQRQEQEQQQAEELKKQMDQEVQEQLNIIQQRIKEEQEAALRNAMKEKLELADKEIKEKERALKELEAKKNQEIEEIAQRFKQEQELKRMEEEQRIEREYQMKVQQEEAERQELQRIQREKEEEQRRQIELIKAEQEQKQQREVENLRIEMEKRLQQIMEEQLMRQKELEDRQQKIKEEDEFRVLQLKQQAEQAASETRRMQMEILQKQQEEENERIREIQQQEVRRQQQELERNKQEILEIKNLLLEKERAIEEQRNIDSAEAKRKEDEQRQLIEMASQMKKQLEEQIEYQKQMEKIKEEEMAQKAEIIRIQEQQRIQQVEKELQEKLEKEKEEKLQAKREAEKQRFEALILQEQLRQEQLQAEILKRQEQKKAEILAEQKMQQELLIQMEANRQKNEIADSYREMSNQDKSYDRVQSNNLNNERSDTLQKNLFDKSPSPPKKKQTPKKSKMSGNQSRKKSSPRKSNRSVRKQSRESDDPEIDNQYLQRSECEIDQVNMESMQTSDWAQKESHMTFGEIMRQSMRSPSPTNDEDKMSNEQIMLVTYGQKATTSRKIEDQSQLQEEQNSRKMKTVRIEEELMIQQKLQQIREEQSILDQKRKLAEMQRQAEEAAEKERLAQIKKRKEQAELAEKARQQELKQQEEKKKAEERLMRLEQERLLKEKQMYEAQVVDQAVARLTGQYLIDIVETMITEIYDEHLVDVHYQKQQEQKMKRQLEYQKQKEEELIQRNKIENNYLYQQQMVQEEIDNYIKEKEKEKEKERIKSLEMKEQQEKKAMDRREKLAQRKQASRQRKVSKSKEGREGSMTQSLVSGSNRSSQLENMPDKNSYLSDIYFVRKPEDLEVAKLLNLQKVQMNKDDQNSSRSNKQEKRLFTGNNVEKHDQNPSNQNKKTANQVYYKESVVHEDTMTLEFSKEPSSPGIQDSPPETYTAGNIIAGESVRASRGFENQPDYHKNMIIDDQMSPVKSMQSFDLRESRDQYEQIFSGEAPIKFRARRANKLEELMQKIIKKHKITIPIVWIRAQFYLVGSVKCTCEIKINNVMVRVDRGIKKLEDYLVDNQAKQQQILIEYMHQSQLSLHDVCELLIKGQKIPRATKDDDRGLNPNISTHNQSAHNLSRLDSMKLNNSRHQTSQSIAQNTSMVVKKTVSKKDVTLRQSKNNNQGQNLYERSTTPRANQYHTVGSQKQVKENRFNQTRSSFQEVQTPSSSKLMQASRERKISTPGSTGAFNKMKTTPKATVGLDTNQQRYSNNPLKIGKIDLMKQSGSQSSGPISNRYGSSQQRGSPRHSALNSSRGLYEIKGKAPQTQTKAPRNPSNSSNNFQSAKKVTQATNQSNDYNRTGKALVSSRDGKLTSSRDFSRASRGTPSAAQVNRTNPSSGQQNQKQNVMTARRTAFNQNTQSGKSPMRKRGTQDRTQKQSPPHVQRIKQNVNPDKVSPKQKQQPVVKLSIDEFAKEKSPNQNSHVSTMPKQIRKFDPDNQPLASFQTSPRQGSNNSQEDKVQYETQPDFDEDYEEDKDLEVEEINQKGVLSQKSNRNKMIPVDSGSEEEQEKEQRVQNKYYEYDQSEQFTGYITERLRNCNSSENYFANNKGVEKISGDSNEQFKNRYILDSGADQNQNVVKQQAYNRFRANHIGDLTMNTVHEMDSEYKNTQSSYVISHSASKRDVEVVSLSLGGANGPQGGVNHGSSVKTISTTQNRVPTFGEEQSAFVDMSSSPDTSMVMVQGMKKYPTLQSNYKSNQNESRSNIKITNLQLTAQKGYLNALKKINKQESTQNQYFQYK